MSVFLRQWRKGTNLLCLILAIVILPSWPVFVVRAEEGSSGSGPADSGDSFNFSDYSPGATTAAAVTSASNALKARTAPVSASGGFTNSIPLRVPPGRLGHTPALALAYSSDSARQESPVGAGWSLATPSITRSTRNGFPPLASDRESPAYDDQGPFEGPAGLLVPDQTTATPGLQEGGLLFLPQREHEPLRYEFVPDQDRWVEHLPSGGKRFYGAYGDHAARIRNELGTHRWLLLAEEDFFGNLIEYGYHHLDAPESGQNRGDSDASLWLKAQTLPVLRSVRWGGNARFDELAHLFQVLVSIRPYQGPLDMLNGHTVQESVIEAIEVYGPTQDESGNDELYWRYDLDPTSIFFPAD